jgi:hypothetical protein
LELEPLLKMLPASLSGRWVSQEFVETTVAGGFFTILAYTVLLWLRINEALAYLRELPE